MKPYWLFQGYMYYPQGGMLDFVGSFDTLEEAQALIPSDTCIEWAHIFHNGAIIFSVRGGERLV